jgi:hypothetical protein
MTSELARISVVDPTFVEKPVCLTRAEV